MSRLDPITLLRALLLILLSGAPLWAVELEQHPIDDLIEGDRKAPELANQPSETEAPEAALDQEAEPQAAEQGKPVQEWYENPVETRPALPTYTLPPADQFFTKSAIAPEEKTGAVHLLWGEEAAGVQPAPKAPADDKLLEEDFLDPAWWSEEFGLSEDGEGSETGPEGQDSK